MELLRKALDREGIAYTENTMEKFRAYRSLVLNWNEKVNLTAIKDPDMFEVKHFVDSVCGAGFYAPTGFNRIIDVGTGAGFPGMPLAILFPEKQFTLLDSLNKRIRILREIADALDLRNITALHGRAEDLAVTKDHRETYDICISRAVARMAVLSELCLPFVRTEGYFAAYKGIAAGSKAELYEAERAIKLLGGKLQNTAEFEIHTPNDTEIIKHRILYFKKIHMTPAQYPRKAGMPEKKPL